MQHGPARAEAGEEVSNGDFTEGALVPRVAPGRQWIIPNILCTKGLGRCCPCSANKCSMTPCPGIRCFRVRHSVDVGPGSSRPVAVSDTLASLPLSRWMLERNDGRRAVRRPDPNVVRFFFGPRKLLFKPVHHSGPRHAPGDLRKSCAHIGFSEIPQVELKRVRRSIVHAVSGQLLCWRCLAL